MIQVTRTTKPKVLVVSAENWKQKYLEARVIYSDFHSLKNKKIV